MSGKSLHNQIKSKLKENNRPFIFMICLFIAASLWFINAMEKQYENYVMIPVQFTNFPKNKNLISTPPSKLRAKIKARGFTLLRYKINASIYPVNFNIKSFTNSKFDNQIQGDLIILPDEYIYQITDQLDADISILDLYPDTIRFSFDNVIGKKVKVASNITTEFDNQYFMSDSIKFTPQSVTVTGPSSVLDTLKYIYTEDIKTGRLNSSFKKNISLKIYEDLDVTPEKVQVEIPVSQYTEYIEKVSVTKLNVPDSVNIVTFPGKVELNCIIALNQFKNISPSDFQISIDYNDIKPDSRQIPVKILKTPPNVRIIKYQPSSVEFIIERK